MLAHEDNRDIIKVHEIHPKVNQIIYTFNTIRMPYIMILAQGVLQVFRSQCPVWFKCLNLKKGIIFNQMFKGFYKKLIMSSTSCTQLYALYNDATSSGFPDIFFKYYIKCQRRKRETIQSNIYRILPKGNQVIYTLYTICMANIILLVQGVSRYFIHEVLYGLNA